MGIDMKTIFLVNKTILFVRKKTESYMPVTHLPNIWHFGEKCYSDFCEC